MEDDNDNNDDDIHSLITKEGDQDAITATELEQQFHALRRLVASKAGFSAFTTLSGFREKVWIAL